MIVAEFFGCENDLLTFCKKEKLKQSVKYHKSIINTM